MFCRYDICGSGVSALTKDQALALLRGNDYHVPKYICIANAHTVTTAVHDRLFREATNNAWLCLPSGKPVSVLGNILYGAGSYERIFGPDFMAECLARSEELDLTHFFYGATTEVLEELEAKYALRLGSRIRGHLAPPFGTMQQRVIEAHFRRINEVRPKMIWVALGAPRQEIFMYENLHRLAYGVMVGVGAAFAFETGSIRRAPLWMQECGLQWLHRLVQEPRLWRRYLVSNPLFVYYAGCAVLARRFARTGRTTAATPGREQGEIEKPLR